MRTNIIVAALISGLALMVAGCGGQAESGSTDDIAAKIAQLAPLVNPNSADRAALEQVPGLSAQVIDTIVADRPFASPSALHAAVGPMLGEDGGRAAYAAMFIPVDLNTAAEEDIRLIPSSIAPGKLAHEFDEYRPYENLSEFVREMAKYVGDEEAIGLTRYVTLD